MLQRRPSGSLLFSLAIHVAVAAVLANVAFHYDFSSLAGPRVAAAPTEARPAS